MANTGFMEPAVQVFPEKVNAPIKMEKCLCLEMMEKLAKSTITTWAGARGYAPSSQDLEDAVSDTFCYILENPNCFQDFQKKHGDRHIMAILAKMLRQRYINVIRVRKLEHRKYMVVEDNEDRELSQIPRTGQDPLLQILEVEYQEMLKQRTTTREYMTAQLLISGYTQQEIAYMVKTSIRSIQREYSGLRKLFPKSALKPQYR